LIPHKYKFIFQSKYNYLKSQKDSHYFEVETLKVKYEEDLAALKESFALETEQLYDIISSQTKDLIHYKGRNEYIEREYGRTIGYLNKRVSALEREIRKQMK